MREPNRQANVQDSDAYRMPKQDELTEARDFLEQCTYNPNTAHFPMPNHLKELLTKAKQLHSEGTIVMRPKSIWIEAIKPQEKDYDLKEVYNARMRSWIELRAKIIDDQTIVTYMDEGKIESRFYKRRTKTNTLIKS